MNKMCDAYRSLYMKCVGWGIGALLVFVGFFFTAAEELTVFKMVDRKTWLKFNSDNFPEAVSGIIFAFLAAVGWIGWFRFTGALYGRQQQKENEDGLKEETMKKVNLARYFVLVCALSTIFLVIWRVGGSHGHSSAACNGA